MQESGLGRDRHRHRPDTGRHRQTKTHKDRQKFRQKEGERCDSCVRKESNTQDVTLEHVDAHPLFLRVFVCVKLLHLTGSSGGFGHVAAAVWGPTTSEGEPVAFRAQDSPGGSVHWPERCFEGGGPGALPLLLRFCFPKSQLFPALQNSVESFNLAFRQSPYPKAARFNRTLRRCPLRSRFCFQVLLWQGG